MYHIIVHVIYDVTARLALARLETAICRHKTTQRPLRRRRTRKCQNQPV